MRKFFILMAGLLVSGGAAAQERVALGTFKSWDAFTIGAGAKKQCYMASVPTSKAPDNVGHGQVYATVTHKPEVKVRDEVNVVVGYPLKDGSDVRVTIGAETLSMFTAGQEAWADSPAKDAQLVAAMKKGSEMTARGTSARGTATTYKFSLFGFSAAYNAISQACGR
ncbi:MAG: invasion associated locus B family protein [Alphaproteobacteria bacterium]